MGIAAGFRRRATAAGLALALAAAPAAGRVYRLREGAHGAASAGRPGWVLAYAADLQVNGGTGRLEVVGFEGPPGEAPARLRAAYRALGLSVWLQGSADLAWGFAVDPDRIVRLLLVAPTPGEGLLFRFDQTRAEFLRSAERPRAHRLEAIPPPPGGTPQFHLADLQAGLAIEISRSPQAAPALTRFFAESLPRDGWTPLPPGAAPGAGPAALLYARDRHLALVHVAASGSAGGASTVVRLVQRQRAAADIADPRPLR